MLYIVATPIGNLEDITLRALRILKEVDIILCEDTRVTRKLLDHYEITGKKLISYHQHSKDKKVNSIIELIKNNKVALVTDAGTPGISDPGNLLVSKFLSLQVNKFNKNNKLSNLERSETYKLTNLKTVPIPGASAVIAALSVSGLPTDRFIFKGFVPHKKGREKFLHEVVESKITVVFYESPYRILKCLKQLDKLCRNEVLPRSKQIVVCRELTKKFETIYRGTAKEILEQIKKDFPNGSPRGEFVVILS